MTPFCSASGDNQVFSLMVYIFLELQMREALIGLNKLLKVWSQSLYATVQLHIHIVLQYAL